MVLGSDELTSGAIVVAGLLLLVGFLQASTSDLLDKLLALPVKIVKAIMDAIGDAAGSVFGSGGG